MKLLTSLAMVAVAASALAQSPSTAQNVRNQLSGGNTPAAATSPAAQSGKAATLPARPMTPKATAKPTTVAVTPGKAAKPAAKVQKTRAKAPVKSAEKKEKPTTAPEMRKPAEVASRRDPFLSPVVERAGSGGGGCSGGKKCLVPDQIRLQGIVTMNSGHIAVVVNGENRAFFLHENDPIYNGIVTKINENSVTFREQVKDVLGKPATREVVKKINTPA